ncbi:MAG: IS1634 family transposase, partial [Planctomycetota bacterium]|nr:IS1634 family transposase [Planctomycetota bacterium]
MYIRQYMRKLNGTRQAYWALVESTRTARGPRQRIVAWLGRLDEQGRLGVEQAAQMDRGKNPSGDRQQSLFAEEFPIPEPRWVEVNAAGVRAENPRQFGGPWLALELVRRLGLDEFLERVMPRGKERIPWSLTSLILVIARLLEPSSELFTAEQWYPKTALPELLGVPAANVDDNRLYRALDELLPHKRELERHLKQRMGELFALDYDLLLYDVTSTFFEGAAHFPMAQRGYSRDQRGDCKQVCIGLVVSRCGMPLGYEVFPGNTADVSTVQGIVTEMEARYGKSDRVWVMDRGMVSEKNLEFFREGGRKYLVGTPKALLKKYERELLAEDWRTIRDGIEVKLIPVPPSEKDEPETQTENVAPPTAATVPHKEIFIMCRSRDRVKKEEAMWKRFEDRIEESLKAMATRCEKQRRDPQKVERDVGRLLGQNTRAARLFEVKVERREDGFARLTWQKIAVVRDWAQLSAGCYLLRTNVLDWSDEELWKTYMQLTEAEAAFRIHKSDLSIRPIWHQKEDRVLAHILVCFLSYVLWKTLGQICQKAGLGNEPRRVLAEFSEVQLIDVILPIRAGHELTERCVSGASAHLKILLDH